MIVLVQHVLQNVRKSTFIIGYDVKINIIILIIRLLRLFSKVSED
jgi:hypothetical protein